MPFALVNDPSNSEISEAINYLLANFGSNLIADPNTGVISGPSGVTIAYLYRYLAVKYADSFDGSLNFSNSPTNRLYYGLRNTDDTTESTNPADYIWFRVTGGFGTTKFLYYQTGGGRQIQFVVATTSPGSTYIQETGPAIDLDIVTTTTAYNTATLSIYKWTSTSTPPTRPTTTSTYTWATGAYTAPSGWTTTPTTNTTPGSYLWAITITLVVSSNTTTSTLDWTNTLYPIYAFSYNGANGATGGNGISALTAYRVQIQSATKPSTPSNTIGATAPTGWYLTLSAALAALTPPQTSVPVGYVVWYIFGQYNSSSATLNGVPAGQTAWSAPTAASVFQDIMSDNWVSGGGAVPPTYGISSTYSTTGYYISQSTGNVYFNNGIFRADITTSGDAVFKGDNPTSTTIPVYDSLYYIDYSSLGDGTTTASLGNVRAGVLGTAVSTGSIINVGVIGYGTTPSGVSGSTGIGVVGSSNNIGGYFSSTLTTGVGLVCNAASTTSRAFQINQGRFAWGAYTIAQPTGSTTTFLRNDGTWSTIDAMGGYPATSWARIFVGDTGTANAAGSGMNFNCLITGYQFRGTSNIMYLEPVSDRRLKENIQPEVLGLDFVNALKPVTYHMIGQERKAHGFIAQDIEPLITETNDSLKIENSEGIKGVDYLSLIAPLVKAVQELSTEVEALKAQLKV